MCGIFGLISSDKTDISSSAAHGLLDRLFVLSESRGKEASGVVVLTDQTIHVLKDALPASRMIRSRKYTSLLRSSPSASTMIGHSRLVTNGAQMTASNNQPVMTQGAIGVHNGIVVNDQSLWDLYPDMKRECQVDTEVLLALIQRYYRKSSSMMESVRRAFGDIEGAASIAVVFEELNHVLLATNNGSLYACLNQSSSSFVFASERSILEKLIKQSSYDGFRAQDIIHIPAGEAMWIDVNTLDINTFSINDENAVVLNVHRKRREIVGAQVKSFTRAAVSQAAAIVKQDTAQYDQLWVSRNLEIDTLKRCSCCVLPETMPFIEFDAGGVCNYCRSYRPIVTHSINDLEESLRPYRRRDGRPDCIVTFSGGRDSCYGLHYIKTVLKMNPVAYTYDWGMITDLGRRNQSRMCGKLGVEHILISADIKRKRENIRRNVSAWLKNPDMGTVPLFMAGDKQYFYYANKLRQELGVEPVILCENMLETTRFKSGYCGIAPRFDGEHTYSLTAADKMQMGAYYAKQYLMNPSYINRSLIDTMGAFFSYYVMDHNFTNLFGYMKWDEKEIDRILLEEYNWEKSPDTPTTWRIGDGTAAFYNYIYYWASGFTENDTFRSNQIREGMITRERALELVEKENRPRYESIQWYCDTIGIDWTAALDIIHKMPHLKRGEAAYV